MLTGNLMSSLVRKFATQEEKFLQQSPQVWLIWESSFWSAPNATDETRSKATGLLNHPTGTRGPGGDALCFGLGDDRPKQPVTIRLGRGSTCDVLINDGTVSREHVLIVGKRDRVDGWRPGATASPGAAGRCCWAKAWSDRSPMVIRSASVRSASPSSCLRGSSFGSARRWPAS